MADCWSGSRRELRDAGLTLLEDRVSEARPVRTWAGIVDGVTFGHFADAWHLDRKAARSA